VPLGAGRQEEHRLKPPRRDLEQFLGEVQREPAEPAVDVPEFFEVDDDAGRGGGHAVTVNHGGTGVKDGNRWADRTPASAGARHTIHAPSGRPRVNGAAPATQASKYRQNS
jgi:hypothetical protein